MDLIIMHEDDGTCSTLQLKSEVLKLNTSDPFSNFLIDGDKTYIFSKDGFYITWAQTKFFPLVNHE
jgi:hypothetical protein